MSLTVSPQGKTTSISVNSMSMAGTAPLPPEKVEPTKEVSAPTKEVNKPERIAPQLAEIAQRAKADREAQRKWQAERDAWESQKSGFISLEDLKKNPLQYMDKAGVTYDQLQNDAKIAVDPVQSELMKVKAKLAEYENKFKSYDENQTKVTEGQRVAATKQIVYETEKIAEAPEYEVLRAFGEEGYQEVAKKILEHYDTTGKLMDVADAVKAVNAEYTEELKTRFGSLSLFKTATGQSVEALSKPTAQATQQQTQARTLTNSMTPAGTRKFTANERRERAIRVMRGEKLD